jgi:hypothetical protein
MGLLILINVINIGILTAFIFDNKNQWLVKKAVLVLSIVYGIIFGFRHGYILSTDYLNYVSMYDTFPEDYFDQGMSRVEPLFAILIIIGNKLNISAEFFLIFISILFNLIIGIFSNKFSKNKIITFLLFTTTSFYFNFASNTIRQGLAFSFFILGVQSDKNSKKFIFFLLAIFTHFTAAFAVLAYVFSKYFKLDNYRFLILISLMLCPLLFFVNPESIFRLFGALIIGFEIFEKASGNIDSGEYVQTGRFYFTIFLIILIATTIYYKKIISKIKCDTIFNCTIFQDLYRFSVISIIFFPLLSQFSVFVRISSYSLFFIPLFINVLFSTCFIKKQAKWLNYFSYAFMSLILYYQLNYLMV